MELLQQIDLFGFHLINGTLGFSQLTPFFAFITDFHKMHLVKFGFFPALLCFWIWRQRSWAVKSILICAFTISVSDLILHRVIKPAVARPRPFADQSVQAQLRLPYEPGGFSFPSNHAANCFTTAGILGWYVPVAAPYLYAYAVVVSYSRPFLGVHYPSDILGGAIFGLLWAFLVRGAVRRWIPKWGPRTHSEHEP